jgi:hypothetical protein
MHALYLAGALGCGLALMVWQLRDWAQPRALRPLPDDDERVIAEWARDRNELMPVSYTAGSVRGPLYRPMRRDRGAAARLPRLAPPPLPIEVMDLLGAPTVEEAIEQIALDVAKTMVIPAVVCYGALTGSS